MLLKTPYLLFLGDAPDPLAAKVAQGVKDWRPEHALGQFRMAGCQADLGVPDMTIAEGRAAGAQTLVIGVANRGGVISEAWIAVLLDALEAGMDVAAGLHNKLVDVPVLKAEAERLGRSLIDVRYPKEEFPIATGEKRAGKRLVPIGTDCSCGKMYTTLAMARRMQARGMNATFRPTGQTGIFIEGHGVPLDAVIADFIAGAVEALSPANDPDHWDLIEGQGSLQHPSFAGVTTGLIHGGQPDALVLCHEPTRTHMRGLPHYPIPSFEEAMDLGLRTARLTNPAARFVGVSVNTARQSPEEAAATVAAIEEQLGLPTVDPVRDGVDRLIDALEGI